MVAGFGGGALGRFRSELYRSGGHRVEDSEYLADALSNGFAAERPTLIEVEVESAEGGMFTS